MLCPELEQNKVREIGGGKDCRGRTEKKMKIAGRWAMFKCFSIETLTFRLREITMFTLISVLIVNINVFLRRPIDQAETIV